MRVLNRIRRVVGLHVHDWEEIATEAHRAPRPEDSVRPGWRPWDLAPLAPVFELQILRCRTCNRTRSTRVRVG